jgi:LmbE family N-acetylglucosaminyl deacetylase
MVSLALPVVGRRALRVLCLGAHADDIEIGCGGTLLELRRRRPAPDIRWVVFSGDSTRAAEARRGAAGLLGAAAGRRVTTCDFRDGYFPGMFAEIKEMVQSLAREHQPDVVFTHARHDRHQDHRVLSDLAWNAFRRQLILEYEIPKWDGDLAPANLYVPLSRQSLERKVRVLESVYATQRSKDWFDAGTFRGLARIRGLECRSPSGFAEAFQARKLTLGVGS